jgi:hypothetical protein
MAGGLWTLSINSKLLQSDKCFSIISSSCLLGGGKNILQF